MEIKIKQKNQNLKNFQILNDRKILNNLRSEMSSTKIVSTEKEFNEIFNLYKNLSN